jgi:hypothetical protein
MSRFPRFKFFIGTMWCAGALLCASASAQSPLEKEIAAVTERVYLAPREALTTLAKIQASHAPLSPRQRALVYEQLSKAKFFANDFSGALHEERGCSRRWENNSMMRVPNVWVCFRRHMPIG